MGDLGPLVSLPVGLPEQMTSANRAGWLISKCCHFFQVTCTFFLSFPRKFVKKPKGFFSIFQLTETFFSPSYLLLIVRYLHRWRWLLGSWWNTKHWKLSQFFWNIGVNMWSPTLLLREHYKEGKCLCDPWQSWFWLTHSFSVLLFKKFLFLCVATQSFASPQIKFVLLKLWSRKKRIICF